MAEVLAHQFIMPHAALIYTREQHVADFDVRKVRMAIDQRRREGMLGTDAAIWELEIHPSNFCNLQCLGCSYGSRHDSRRIDNAAVRDLIRFYSSYDLRTVFISGGGDPAYWRGWARVFGDDGISVPRLGVSTNLSALHNLRKVFDKLTHIQIHVVGHDRESVKRETGVDCFDRIAANLDDVFRMKRPDQQIIMKVLIKESNYVELEHFLDFVARHPCDSVVLKLEQDFLENREVVPMAVVDELRSRALEHSIGSRFDYVLDGLEDGILPLVELEDETACSFPDSGLYRLATADGLLYPCIASTYDRSNALSTVSEFLTGGGSVGVSRKSPIDVSKCPVRACRHFRMSLVSRTGLIPDASLPEVRSILPDLL